MERKYSKQASWFTQNARSKMFVSFQANHGIQIAVRFTVKAVKCLLKNGCIFLLTGRFCWGPVKEHLGIQRQLGESGLAG